MRIGRTLLLTLLGLLVAAAVAGWFTKELWEPRALELLEGSRLTGLEDRIARLEGQTDAIPALADRVAKLEARTQNPPPAAPAAALSPGAADANLQSRVAALEQQWGGVAEVRATQTQLADRVAALERQAAARAKFRDSTAALVIAVAQLQHALDGSGPYDKELDAVRRLAGDDPAIASLAGPLKAHAATGIPTLTRLRDSFPAIADRMVHPADQAGTPWFERLSNRLKGLVTVRRTGEAALSGDPVEVAIARTEAALNAGDLQEAVRALSGVYGPPAKAAADWLEQARARLEAEEAANALETRAAQKLAEDKAAGKD